LDLVIHREQLLQKYTPQYENVIELDKQIARARKRIEVEIHQIMDMELAAIRALRTEERVLQNSIDKTINEIKELAQKEYEFSQLSRGIDDNREVYSMLLKQREEARISLSKLQKGIRISVISPAIVPADPTRPNKKLNIALALFLGMVGGLSLALFMEYFDHSISSQYELERFAELPVLGSVREVNRGKSSSQHKVRVKVTKAKLLPPKHTYEYS
jgi:succinoglycan biosynthesis transport protein ExoP